jgi:tetratricopeptide (TPR) repeat protein
LSNLINKNDDHKKNIYFFLSIAYKRIGDTDSALRILNIAIDKIPKYYDALLFRGKLLAKQRKYLEAVDDFKACVKL